MSSKTVTPLHLASCKVILSVTPAPGIQSARGSLTARPKFTLLSPVPRLVFKPRTKRNLTRLLKQSTPKSRLEYGDLSKGFRLYRKLFALDPDPRPLIVPAPEPQHIPTITAEKPKPTFKLKLPESQTISTPTLLDLDSGFQTPRRRLSTIPEQLPVSIIEKKPMNAQSRPIKPMLIPVLRLQVIDASELSSSSSEESCHLSRRSSKIHRTTPSPVPSDYTHRRLTLAEPQQSLMTEYTQRTAGMLADTQFRIRSYKAQRIFPQRYFKNL